MPTERDLFQLSEQDARVLKATRMLPNDAPLSDKQLTQVALDTLAYLKEHGLSQAALAAGMGENETYVSNFLFESARREMPAKRAEKLARDISVWIEEDFRHRTNKIETAFVKTVVAERLFGLARNVRNTRDIGVGYGPAGIGKTLCAKAFALEFPGTIFLRVTRTSRTESGFMLTLYKLLRRSQRGRRSPTFEDIVDELRGSGRLLIIDQAQDLRDATYTFLLNLHDEAELPMLLLGTVDVRKRVDADSGVLYGQMSSRVGPRINLVKEIAAGGGSGGKNAGKWMTVEQIRAMFKGGKLRLSAGAAQMLAHIANYELGFLRRAQRIHRWAEFTALLEKATEITPKHIQESVRWVDDEERRIPMLEDDDRREVKTA